MMALLCRPSFGRDVSQRSVYSSKMSEAVVKMTAKTCKRGFFTNVIAALGTMASNTWLTCILVTVNKHAFGFNWLLPCCSRCSFFYRIGRVSILAYFPVGPQLFQPFRSKSVPGRQAPSRASSSKTARLGYQIPL
jgi:hypothetical protein